MVETIFAKITIFVSSIPLWTFRTEPILQQSDCVGTTYENSNRHYFGQNDCQKRVLATKDRAKGVNAVTAD